MKILVTGAGGFLGVAVTRRLLEHGHRNIRCLIRDPGKRPKLDALSAQYPGALEIITGNLGYQSDAAAAIEGVQVVYHLAAAMKGAAADMFRDSVVASRNLLDAVAQRKTVRIVLVSSFGVYGVASLGRGALVNEETPLEPNPAQRDLYSFSKLRQELLFRQYAETHGFELVVLRPGVIYGPGSGHFSGRVGLNLFGIFVHLGGRNVLPLTYIENCAEAIVVAGMSPQAAGQTFNVHDDELPRSRDYLKKYKRDVRRIRTIRVPYFLLMLISRMLEAYHRRSGGQLPAIFTPYKTASIWGGHKFDNSQLKSIGWHQVVPTKEGLRLAFESFRASL